MTVTRSQTGRTPRKRMDPSFVETPGTYRRSRKSVAPEERETLEESYGDVKDHMDATGGDTPLNGHLNASFESNGTVKRSRGRPRKSETKPNNEEAKAALDPKIDSDPVFEFGGSWGVSAMMLGFPLLMWYMWIGATYYDGRLPARAAGQSWSEFGQQLFSLAYTGAFPHARAWAIYWAFLVVQVVFYLYLPGVYAKGKPLPHEGGRQLDYYCSGVWSFYGSIAIALALHGTGAFKLYTLIDEFGPLMSVAIISGFAVAVIAYASALWRGAQHRMTGYPIYDFFMGAELNPRLFGWLDFKMFFEVRLPWFILFFISLGAAARQWEMYGYVSPEVGFVLMAHFLYANACCKGEEMIVTTWDMYYEKWGFMLIFWNMAGVPLSYCHCTIYLANHPPDVYAWPRWAMALLYASYLVVYWIWDTANSQKNMFRAQERGSAVHRRTFPQLPWKMVREPRTIPTHTGDSILADGWYGYARKIHYTCDVFFAVSWAAVTGFDSPFPWFYPLFFVAMIVHRAARDVHRCRQKYGEAWKEYERMVPWLFVPYVF